VTDRPPATDADDEAAILIWNGQIAVVRTQERPSAADDVDLDSGVPTAAGGGVPCADARTPTTKGTPEAAEPL